MTGYEFIFSNKPVKKLYRHLFFWAILCLHFSIQNLMVGGANEALKGRSLAGSAFDALFFFPVYILCTYILIDVLLPVYLFKRRYVLFFCWLAILFIFSFIGCYLSGSLYIHITSLIPFNAITFNINKYNAIVNGLFLPIVIYGIAGGIKLAKNWYLEQKENERLAQKKISHELQLLKIQLHPRFLFHSLHTVKKRIHSNPSLAAARILQLSDLLSYILYESNKEWTSLEKELEIIRKYIDLEKRSAENIITTEINIVGNIPDKYIFPLLLLSFIEKSVDYFLKDNDENAFLQLLMIVEDSHVNLRLTYEHSLQNIFDDAEIKKKFIDLEKQLQLMYAKKYQVEIINNEQNISVVLGIPVYIKKDCESITQQKKKNEVL